jgi:hypothetical protein
MGHWFQKWRGMARFESWILWKDGSYQFFGIFHTHEAGLCGNECHISSQSAASDNRYFQTLTEHVIK